MSLVLDKYGNWTIEDAIADLEGFKSIIGYGSLSEHLEVAIDCMRYVLNSVEEQDNI